MSELDFEELVQQLHGLIFFQGLKWKQIVDFVTLASRLKDPILLAQPAGISVTEAPAVLLPSVAAFPASSCNLAPPAVESCWKIVKTTVWKYSESKVETAFAEHGVKHSLTSWTFYPPHQTCQNIGCAQHAKGQPLKKAKPREVMFYTQNKGVLPAYSVHLYCDVCHTNYHHNFHVKDGVHTYYNGCDPGWQASVCRLESDSIVEGLDAHCMV
ncbi:hypothetical protein L208DRAFT_1517689, partial [Tricholoma matsutake]